MLDIFYKIRKNFALKKNKKHLLEVSSLEKKAMNLNIKSKEYVELAKKDSIDWQNKWLK